MLASGPAAGGVYQRDHAQIIVGGQFAEDPPLGAQSSQDAENCGHQQIPGQDVDRGRPAVWRESPHDGAHRDG